jgi:hypothetical protein
MGTTVYGSKASHRLDDRRRQLLTMSWIAVVFGTIMVAASAGGLAALLL